MQLNKLIGRKEEVVFGGFPGFGIGLISAIRQVAGTSPESQERLAVWSRQRWPNGERFRSIVFDISSGPDADLCGNFSRAESGSPSFLTFLPFFSPVPHSSLCVSYIPLSFHYFLLPFSFSQFSLALLLIDLPSDQKKCGSKSHICCYHTVISAMWTKWIDEDNIFIRLCVCLCVHVADQSIRQSEGGGHFAKKWYLQNS